MVTMSRRDFLAEVGSLGVAFVLTKGTDLPLNIEKHKRPPNVIIMIADDQGYGDFSCYSNNILKTPNLDRLYHESTRLTNLITQPLCAPSRAQLLTGRYNYRTGVWDTWQGRQNMFAEEEIIAKKLQKAGYRTGAFGKWDTGYNYPIRPIDQGFDEAVTRVMSPSMDPTMLHNGKPEKYRGFIDDCYFDAAIDFIEKSADKPFFAYIASILPHDGPEPEVPAKYVEPFMSEPSLKLGDKKVYGMVSKLDENVGRVLSKLKELKLEDNTVVIYMADHGPLQNCPELQSYEEIAAVRTKNYGARYNCSLRGGKMTPYEGGIKVPFFIRWPGVFKADKDQPALASTIDIFPTIMDICDIEPTPAVKIDGISLRSLLTDKVKSLPERMIFVEEDRVDIPRMYRNCSVRGERYKLIGVAADCELYDLKKDPGEKHNVAAEHPDIVADMRKKYEAWFKDMTADLASGYVIIGSPEEKQTDLNMYFKSPTAKGWPLKIVSRGPYTITVSGIQHQLFPNGGEICVRFGEMILKKSMPTDSDSITFSGVRLETGLTNCDLWIEGCKKSHLMYYGNDDPGFRDVIIDFAGIRERKSLFHAM